MTTRRRKPRTRIGRKAVPKTVRSGFAKRLKAARGKLSNAAFAKQHGLFTSTVEALIAGHSLPSYETLAKLRRRLDLNKLVR